MRNVLYVVALLLTCVLSASAQSLPSGYYRVKNFGLEMYGNKKGAKETAYIWVTDNHYKQLTGNGTTQSFEQLQVRSDAEFPCVSEPASVIYARNISGNSYNLESQGTGVYQLIGHYLTPTPTTFANIYEVGANVSGVTVKLNVDPSKGIKHYYTTTKDCGQTYRYWYVEPISTTSGNYFGITPTLQAGGKYYRPFYAAFPFKFASDGMKAYYVSGVGDDGSIEMTQIEREVIPAGEPIIIECSSNDASNNRLELLTGPYPTLRDNLLSGTYFCNDFIEPTESQYCRTTFDAKTMRVWNVEGGKLVLSTATDKLHKSEFPGEGGVYLNANQSYLYVGTTAGPSKLNKVLPEAVRTKASKTTSASVVITSGIHNVVLNDDESASKRYFTVDGKEIPSLQRGINIVKYGNGKVERRICE